MKNKLCLASIMFILLVVTIHSELPGQNSFYRQEQSLQQMKELEWQPVVPGVWRARVQGKPEINLLDMAGNSPQIASLNKLEKTEFPLNSSGIGYQVADESIYLKFPLEPDEQIYGLGLNFKRVHQRGRILRLHVDHYGGEDNGRTHAPVPFYISSKGYGVLVNSAKYLEYYIGTGLRKNSPNHPVPRDRNTDPDWDATPESDNIEILIPDQSAEIYIFAGDDPLEVVRRYNLYCGGGVIPPKWGLGFWQRVPTLFTADSVMNEIDAFDTHNFPLDVIGLEPGWQSKSYPGTYEWGRGRFPDPEKFIQSVSEKGIYLNLWMNPYVSPDAGIYDDIKPYTGSHTVWLGLVPDYTLPEAREIFTDHFQDVLLKQGISGLKIDEVDGYDRWLWPDVATFPSGLTGEEMRQTYGLQWQRMMKDLYRKNNLRTYGLVRASNAGSVSMPFVLYNDYYSHRDFITALINSSFSGILWTPEVRSSENGEEWLRRMQTVCFSPLAMINAWSDGTKPWSFPEVYEEVRKVALLRMQLFPYLYSAFARYHFQGIPPFRAMVLEVDPDRKSAGSLFKEEMKDQYMVGENLMVAPIFTGESEREVILPKGKWYDFYTGDYAGNGETIEIKAGLDKIPVFVKNGGIIPMMQEFLSMADIGKQVELTVRHYGDKPGKFRLYDDDGVTYDYEGGEYSWFSLTAITGSDNRLTGKVLREANRYNSAYTSFEWVFMSRE